MYLLSRTKKHFDETKITIEMSVIQLKSEGKEKKFTNGSFFTSLTLSRTMPSKYDFSRTCLEYLNKNLKGIKFLMLVS